ncbi:MAG: hypothetical protein ACI8QZ_004037 [Chlamydiales bacterium]|jgi:hypothetical protein
MTKELREIGALTGRLQTTRRRLWIPFSLAAALAVLLIWRTTVPEQHEGIGSSVPRAAGPADTPRTASSERTPADPTSSPWFIDSERMSLDEARASADGDIVETVTRSGATWTASGRVILVDTDASFSAFRVSYGVGADLREALGVVHPSEAGDWGPVELEFKPSVETWFRLEGGGAIPDTRRLTPEVAGQGVVLDLQARQGEELWFEVYGDDHERLADSLVEVRSIGDAQSAPTWARPREDGYTWVRGCKTGRVSFEVSAPGYASMRGVPFLLPEADPAVIQIQLFRTGRVMGTCYLGESPVTDFEVAYWSAGALATKQTIAFTDRADGSFELPEVRVGSVRLIAMSETLAHGGAAEVAVRVDQTTEVRLELARPLRGAGRIVDRATARPISDARIQLFSSSDGGVVEAWGKMVRTAADGSFELDGLSPESQLFTVRAKGYGAIYGKAVGDPDGLAEIGDVLLSRTQDLEIRLVEIPGMDPTALSIDPGSELPIKRFSRDWTVRYEGFQATSRFFDIDCADSTSVLFNLALVSGEDWAFDLEPFGGRLLVLDLAMADGSQLPYGLEVSVSAVPLGRMRLRQVSLVLDDGHVVFEHLPWDRCSLLIALDDERTIFENTILEFDGGGSLELRKELGRGMRKLQVVDGNGGPVSSLGVVFYGGESGVTPTGITDSTGRLELGALPGDLDRALLYHQSEGVAIGLPVDLSGSPDEEPVLIYDATSRLRARLVDGDRPAFGIQATLGAPGYEGLIAQHKESGSDGALEWAHLNRADFIVTTNHRDYWPTRSVLASGSSSPHEIQVRRLTDLEVKVIDEMGQPVGAARVTARSSEFGASLSQWLESGDIPPIPAGLITDGSGEVEVRGLPHGEYTVTVTSPRGQWSAVVRLEPSVWNRIVATVR